jgi:hypothetical protein
MTVPTNTGATLSKPPGDFLSPTGSLTPAAAGAIVLLITNTLGMVFGAPRALTALSLSGLIGALIVARHDAPLLHRAGYWIVNSLTIFAVALGSNGALATFTTEQPALLPPDHFLAPWL